LLTNLDKNDVLFIDEIHRLSPVVEEVLYPALEDFQLDIMIGEGPAARSIKIDLPPFTLVGATTRAGLLTSPLRDRFGITQRLEFYHPKDLTRIVARSAALMGVGIDEEGANEIAQRSRGTPRIANRLLRRVRDFAEMKANGHITREVANSALNMLNVRRDDRALPDPARTVNAHPPRPGSNARRLRAFRPASRHPRITAGRSSSVALHKLKINPS